MNLLTSHIEYLLTLHDCVIIPEFGGFVLRNQEAKFVNHSKMIPPCKVVGFNAALTHNDGLLANSLMQEKNISFAEAKSMQLVLQRGENMDMGSLGTFCNEEGALQFIPAHQNLFDLNLYGFSDLSLQPIHLTPVLQSEPQVAENDVVMVPVNLRLLRRVTAVVAMITGLLLVSHPLEHGNIPQHYASMISSDLLSKAIVPNFSYYQEQIDQPDNQVASDSVLYDSEVISENDNPAAEMPEEASASSESQTDLKPNITSPVEETILQPQPVKRYYIVVGSFPTEPQAVSRITALARKGLEGVQYLKKDNKYRLYINTFTDKKDANKFLADGRPNHPEGAVAWVVAPRN
ncbi:MAG: SPOR domain-containing protein [Bacteroidales bacterium]